MNVASTGKTSQGKLQRIQSGPHAARAMHCGTRSDAVVGEAEFKGKGRMTRQRRFFAILMDSPDSFLPSFSFCPSHWPTREETTPDLSRAERSGSLR